MLSLEDARLCEKPSHQGAAEEPMARSLTQFGKGTHLDSWVALEMSLLYNSLLSIPQCLSRRDWLAT